MTSPGPVSGARPTRPVGLQDDLGPIGDRAVGHGRDTVIADRKAQPKRRNQLVLVLLGIALAFGAASWYGKRPKASQAAPLAEASKANAGGAADVDPQLRDIAKTRPQADTFPNIDLNSTAPNAGASATTPSPAVDGRGGRGVAGDGSVDHTFSLTPPAPGRGTGTGATGAPGNGGAGTGVASGFPPVTSSFPLLPPDTAHRIPSGPPSIAERVKAAKGFSMGSGGPSGAGSSGALYPTKRSALAPDVATSAGGAAQQSGNKEAPTWTFTPGIEVSATFVNDSPSAASGEPLIAILDVALVDRGMIVLPAGTKAIGTGGRWDDGSNNPRLAVKFVTFVLPDQSVKTLSATAYSPDDHRPGLVVPYNHQTARKGTQILTAAAAAAAFAKLVPPQPQQVSGLSVQVDPTYQARQQAATDVYQSMRQELQLNQPAVSILFELNAGTKAVLVFGLP
jgi:hypothetical protein